MRKPETRSMNTSFFGELLQTISERGRALLERTRPAALHGKYELFKVSNVFDGTAENPEWLG